jgi:hypothetical protein
VDEWKYGWSFLQNECCVWRYSVANLLEDRAIFGFCKLRQKKYRQRP